MAPGAAPADWLSLLALLARRANAEGLHIHYPTLLRHGCHLYVVYSRFYGQPSPHMEKRELQEQGIRIATVDLQTLAFQESTNYALRGPAPDTGREEVANKLKLLARTTYSQNRIRARGSWVGDAWV